MAKSRSGASSKRVSGSNIKRQYLAKLEDWELEGKSSHIVFCILHFTYSRSFAQLLYKSCIYLLSILQSSEVTMEKLSQIPFSWE